ncbi:MAG TPA: hypothetical protein PLY73_00770 [Candidatus Ozemobacteraceae bacterium]|nr:hypothetical protein [Candidatus Ozemobacteraceae bacterium]
MLLVISRCPAVFYNDRYFGTPGYAPGLETFEPVDDFVVVSARHHPKR